MKKTIFGMLLLTFVFGANQLFAQKKVDCPECRGSGKVVEICRECHNGAIFCESCYGKGSIREVCSGCNGTGYTERIKNKICPTCYGNRTVVRQQTTNCSCRGGKRPISRNGQTVYVNCDRCNGTGQLTSQVRETCSTCRGTGYSGTETERIKHNCDNGYLTSKCSRCNGVGSYMCKTCQGYANIRKNCPRCNGNGVIYVYE